MTKRAHQKFERRARDFYATPPSAVLPLIPHLNGIASFDEPCAGDGALVDCLRGYGLFCEDATDIEPRRNFVKCRDAFDIKKTTSDSFITNPPWDRNVLHPLIVHLSDIAPTWLLFDADWIHTKQAVPYLPRLRKIVSVGRVSWMGNGVSGFDNCAWYLFDKPSDSLPVFIGRAA